MDRKSTRTIGYLRVSTVDQDIEKNKADILLMTSRKGFEKVRFVEEKVSGKGPWKKRKIADILEELGDNDNIVVSELSRLGRSMLECMEILSIAAQKGINVYAVKGNWLLAPPGLLAWRRRDGTMQFAMRRQTAAIAHQMHARQRHKRIG